ncbi:MAG: AraC family transcriptional regulator ligand-binding domain-containing protein [Kofleriaceae bacterium]
MGRPVREPPESSALVPALLRLLASRGHTVALAGAPADAAERDELGVPPAQIGELVATAAELLGEPFLALRLPAELPLRRYDVVELALRSSATLREGLQLATRHAAVIHPHVELALVETGDDAIWTQRTPRHPRGIGRHLHEYGLAHVLHHARAGVGELAIRHVWFAHARPRTLAPLERWFGTGELGFGAPDSGFAFARERLDAPLAAGDPRLLATALALVRPPPAVATLAPRVAALLRTTLADPRADAIAASLHMSARTLQRRLEAEGTTFSEVVDRTREAVARELLLEPALALGEIAYRVGFADLATFSRAFKRWTGKPPGLFRRS